MKVVMFYGYSADNAGDMAITVGSLDLISSKATSITVFSRFHSGHSSFYSAKEYLENRYSNVKVLPCAFKLDREAGKIEQLKNYGYSFLKYIGFISNKVVENHIERSDIVIFNGGNLLRCSSIADYLRIKALFHPFKYAQKINKPYFILPQSTSSIQNYGVKEISRMLNSANSVFIREEKSYNKLSKLFPKANFIQSCDAALFIDYKHDKNKALIKKNKVAITVRGYTLGDLQEFDDETTTIIVDRITNLIIDSHNKGFELTFVIQTLKDKRLSLFIVDKVKKEHGISCDIFESNDPVEIGNFYSNCSFLFGMRLHSIILATANGIPCYGYFDKSWGLKNPGFMESFDFSYEFIGDNRKIDIESYIELNSNVYNKFIVMTKKYKEDIINSVYQ